MVTEETKHECVDLVAQHILTNAITPQISSFLEGLWSWYPMSLLLFFHDKELELLINGLPEIDCKLAFVYAFAACFLRATEPAICSQWFKGQYRVTQQHHRWFWEVVIAFSKEDMERLLQFVTGTTKVIASPSYCSLNLVGLFFNFPGVVNYVKATAAIDSKAIQKWHRYIRIASSSWFCKYAKIVTV